MDTQTDVPTDATSDPGMLLFSPETADAPHETYRALREQCPVHKGDFGGNPSVVISRFEDVQWALKHPEVFSSADAVHVGNDRPLIPLQIDPPEHAKYRRLLDPEFSPKKMAALEDDARALVNKLIDGFVDAGRCDFHEDFATPLPSTMFLALMGLSSADLPTFLLWRDNIIRPDVEPGDFDAAAEVRAATGRDIYAYFGAAIDEKHANPDDALLTRLVNAEIEGERLSRDELLDILYLLILGGLDTVTATLDCAIAYLATHPELRAQVAADPTIAPAVVEELLRHQTPVMIVPRVVAQDHTFGDVELTAGDTVTLVLGASNTDDSEFPNAGEVDFQRERNRHLAFGGGPHRCLGSHLARLELRVALDEFHRRIPEYGIEDGVELHFSPGIRQAERLPLVW